MGRYALNFSPLTLEGNTKILVGRQPYDFDLLSDLSAEFRVTHVFHRIGKDDAILDVPIAVGGGHSAMLKTRLISPRIAACGPSFYLPLYKEP
jgi:hypothetical protein